MDDEDVLRYLIMRTIELRNNQASKEEITSVAKAMGFESYDIDGELKSLRTTGRIYEPRSNRFSLTDEQAEPNQVKKDYLKKYPSTPTILDLVDMEIKK
jgi:predicted transcriptional regulator